MVKKKIWIILGIIVILALAFLAIIYFSPQQKAFTKTSLLKSTIPLGGESHSEVKITNYEDKALDFKIYLTHMEGLANLSEASFRLEPRESKVVQISFKDTKNEVNIYLGRLVIEADSLREEIPIILGTESPNFAFAIICNSIPKYENIYSEGKLGVDVKIFDLTGEFLSTIPGNFYIKDFNNEVLFSDADTLVVGGSKSKVVDIPRSWEKDDYLFITIIDYKGTKTMSGYLFTISEEKDVSLPNNIKLILIIIFVFFIGILALFFYFVKTRDEFLIQLRKQQTEEMARNVDYLRHSREVVRKSEEIPKKKEKRLIRLAQTKEKIVEKIKKKQKEQIKKFKELKKKKKKPLLKLELNKWKREGYKMFETENEVKKITNQNMEGQLRKWRKKGYPTGFLKDKKNL